MQTALETAGLFPGKSLQSTPHMSVRSQSHITTEASDAKAKNKSTVASISAGPISTEAGQSGCTAASLWTLTEEDTATVSPREASF